MEGTSSGLFQDHSAQSLGCFLSRLSHPSLPEPQSPEPTQAERALQGCLTWHFSVNLLEHSPVPVPGTVNTLGSEKAQSGHPPNIKPQKFFLMESFPCKPQWVGVQDLMTVTSSGS